MAEQGEVDKYVKCSKCRCKYINDDDHIKNDFGYNRLNERYKTCVTCRVRGRKNNKTYWEIHHAEITERKRDYREQYYQDNKEHLAQLNKQYRDKQFGTEVDDNHKCCKRCTKIKCIKAFTECGETFNSCCDCREKDTIRRWGEDVNEQVQIKKQLKQYEYDKVNK
jgi:hypothetical protein